MVEMTLASIRVQMPDNVPVLLLKEVAEGGASGRTLPILIGHEEATAIARAIQGIESPRPLTHDLMRDLLGALDVTLDAALLDAIDAIVPPGRTINPADAGWQNPALKPERLRRAGTPASP